MNERLDLLRIEELALKSLERQIADSERLELSELLKNRQHREDYQDTMRTIAGMHNIDDVVNNVEMRLHKSVWLKPVAQISAVAACIAVATFAVLKTMNPSDPTADPPVKETFFSQTSAFHQAADRIERKILSKYPPQTRFSNSYEFKRVKSEIKTLRKTPVLGKENGDV